MVLNNYIVGANLNLHSWECKKYSFFLFSMNELVLGFQGSQHGGTFNVSCYGRLIKFLGSMQCQ